MEDFLSNFIDMLGDYSNQLENRIYNNMIIKAFPEDGDTATMLHVVEKFNEHGVSSKVLFEVCAELVKEGVFDAKD